MAILKKLGTRMIKLRDGKSLGQGMMEFGIILPIVLTSFFTIIELARLYHAWVAVENGARFGVRYAITGELDTANCSGGTCTSQSEEDAARVDTIKEVVWGGSETILRKNEGVGNNTDSGFFNTTICDPDNLVGPASQFDTYTCTNGEDAGEPGDQVAVIVEYNHPIIVPLISNIVPQIRLTAERQSIVETFRVVKSDSAPGYSPPPPPPAMTPPPTSTPVPTVSAAYDYCANIEWTKDLFHDQSRYYDEMWKFGALFFNNNDYSMWLTEYYVTWTGNVDLKHTKYGSTCSPSWCSVKIVDKKSSGPAYCRLTGTGSKGHCDPASNIEFVSRPGCDTNNCYPAEIYNMICVNLNCVYASGSEWTLGGGGGVNPPITGSNYTFYAEAVFTFKASETGESSDVTCLKSWSASGNAPDDPAGGGGGYDPPNTPVPGGGGGGGGGGGSPTPDPGSPDD